MRAVRQAAEPAPGRTMPVTCSPHCDCIGCRRAELKKALRQQVHGARAAGIAWQGDTRLVPQLRRIDSDAPATVIDNSNGVVKYHMADNHRAKCPGCHCEQPCDVYLTLRRNRSGGYDRSGWRLCCRVCTHLWEAS